MRAQQGGDIVEGERLDYNFTTDRGSMDKPRYVLTTDPQQPVGPTGTKPRFGDADARGRAERLLFEGPRRYRAEQAEYTTCEPGKDDWFIRGSSVLIEKDRDVGTARDARIVFMDWPIFNVADAAITCGAILLAISFWREGAAERTAAELAVDTLHENREAP